MASTGRLIGCKLMVAWWLVRSTGYLNVTRAGGSGGSRSTLPIALLLLNFWQCYPIICIEWRAQATDACTKDVDASLIFMETCPLLLRSIATYGGTVPGALEFANFFVFDSNIPVFLSWRIRTQGYPDEEIVYWDDDRHWLPLQVATTIAEQLSLNAGLGTCHTILWS